MNDERTLTRGPAADLAILGAQLWDPGRSAATAVAVAGGRVVAVGSDAEIQRLIRPETRVIDAEGAAVLPGFHDAHIHALAGGIGRSGCDLEGEHSLPGYERVIREHAARAAPGEWIVGSGWFGDVFPGGLPTRGILDRIVPDRPVVLTSHDAHGVWVNSHALELAGITRASVDPPAGRIVRDEAGEPTGMLLDTAGEAVTRLIPDAREEDLIAALIAAQEYLFSLGITAWHDAILGQYLTLPDSTPAYLATLAAGTLLARVSGSLWWPPGAGPDRVPEILGAVARVREAGLDVRGVKIMQDGICENCTAALIEPYRGTAPETRGDSVIPPADLALIATAIDAAGLSVHFHGVGDRAVRECLDAVAAARTANGAGQPHQIAHLDVVDPADIQRFAELGVTANLQPLWARDDQEILARKYPLIGEDRARYHFPFGSLERAGAHLAMGSDWPVTSPDPLWGLHTACTRTAPSADPHALNPESRVAAQPGERLSPETAIRAYTLGAAEITGRASDLGAIAPGMLADLVILDGPIDGAESFDRASVARTILGGETVYAADA